MDGPAWKLTSLNFMKLTAQTKKYGPEKGPLIEIDSGKICLSLGADDGAR